MKKISLLLTVLFLCGARLLNAQALTVSVTPSICFDPNTASNNTVSALVTTTLSNVTAYNWTVFPASGTPSCAGTYTLTNSSGTAITAYFPCGGAYVISCTAKNGTVTLANSTASVSIVDGKYLGLPYQYLSCNNSTVAMWSYYGSNYSWSDGNGVISTNSMVVVNPSVTTCYTLSATVLGTCSVSAVTCVSVAPSISITANIIHSSTAHCLYSPVTLTASGATAYVWIASGTNFSSGSNPLNYYLQNTAPCYTVIGGVGGCTASAVVCTTAQPALPLTLSVVPSQTICYGGTATLIASGAPNYTWSSYWQNMNNTTPTVAVTPTVSGWYTGYTVTATDSLGCTTSTNVYIMTTTGPTISFSGSSTICPGQNKTLTVSGPGPFSWFDGTNVISTASFVTVSPTVTTCYTVTNGASTCSVNSVCLYVVNAPVITLQGGTSCSNWGTSITAQGGNYYSWSVGTSTSNNIWVTPQVTTCYTVTGYLSAGCSGTAAACVTVVPAPSFTGNVSNVNVCAGNSVTLATMPNISSWWASDYNWNNIITGTSNIVVITPSVSGTYSVVITSTNSGGPYCPSTFTTNINVMQPPLISISGNNICLGSSTALSASGASNYTWSTGATGNFINISPTSNTCYTVTGTTTIGCINTAVKCITVYPIPVITISGNNTVCAGSSVVLTASGGNFYIWKPNISGVSLTVSPTSATCYTVTGYSQYCTNTAVHCVTPMPSNIGVSANSATVCKGTSADFTATGGVTYTWSTGSNNSTVNILPTASSTYTMWGTNANGCTGSQIITMIVDSTCTDVWPGDANSDGVVGTTDVLEIGLAFSATGPARNNASNNYVAQKASNWSGTVSSGKNKAHADCDGNGTVALPDTLAIFNNFGLTHSFKNSAQHANIADVMLVSNDHYLINPGMWNKLDIMVGDEFNIINAYGIAFEIDYDQSLVESNSTYIVYEPSFLNTGNQQVEFRKSFFNNGKMYAATVRTDKTDVTGNGKIGEFYFLAKSDLPETTVMNVSVNNALKVNSNRDKLELSGNQAELTMNSNPVGIKKTDTGVKTSFYPNPASNSIILKSSETSVTNFSITDVTGRQIMKGEFTKTLNVNTSALQNGTYFISFISERSVTTEKMIIQR